MSFDLLSSKKCFAKKSFREFSVVIKAELAPLRDIYVVNSAESACINAQSVPENDEKVSETSIRVSERIC